MKYLLECDVDSTTLIHKEIKIPTNNYDIYFIPNEKGILNKIKIIHKVEDPQKYESKIEPSNDGISHHKATINGDKELHDNLIELFQTIESAMAIDWGIKKIYWESPRNEVICETEEEEKLIQIRGTHWEQNYPDPLIEVSEGHLKDLVDKLPKYENHKIALSFWREGNLEYKSFRYINAFYNFYFIIEGMFTDGNTNKSAQKKQFLESSLKEYVKWTMNSIKENPEKKEEIDRLLKTAQKEFNEEGIIHLIVETRGDLHHFNQRRVRGTPFNHKSYHTLSWVCLGLATHTLLQEIVKINNDLE